LKNIGERFSRRLRRRPTAVGRRFFGKNYFTGTLTPNACKSAAGLLPQRRVCRGVGHTDFKIVNHLVGGVLPLRDRCQAETHPGRCRVLVFQLAIIGLRTRKILNGQPGHRAIEPGGR